VGVGRDALYTAWNSERRGTYGLFFAGYWLEAWGVELCMVEGWRMWKCVLEDVQMGPDHDGCEGCVLKLGVSSRVSYVALNLKRI
jgi:hypothetical protein